MEPMRKVTFDGRNFQVTDDPENVLGEFLAFAISDPSVSLEAIRERISPGARGYSVPDTAGAAPVTTIEDVMDVFGLEDQPDLPDLSDHWIVWVQRRTGTDNALVAGEELRNALATAASLWKPPVNP
jgi:hypothetical protein